MIEPFVEEYLAGRTPIPCTLCNNFIKFDQFLEMADAVGAQQIATGHYARITYDEPPAAISCARRWTRPRIRLISCSGLRRRNWRALVSAG